MEALFGLSTKYMTTHEPALIAADFGMWLIIVFLFTSIYMRQPKPDWQNAQREPLLKKVVLILAMFGIVLVIDWIDKRWNPLALPENQVYINELMKAVPILTTLSNDLFAPTLEELLFRGIFFNLFFIKKTKCDTVMKIVVSGLVFGCAHQLKIDYNWLIYCSFGWLLGSTYFWTKDIRCSIVLHMLVNLF